MMKQRNNKFYKKSNKKESIESSDEETELFVRNESPKKQISSIEKEINNDDTLQSLAIRHQCTIEDLKRLNNIHKENEIYARRKIKVPHRPFSEVLAEIHLKESSSSITSPISIINNEPSTSKLIDIDSLEAVSNSEEFNEIIFNSNILAKDRENPEDLDLLDEDEDIQLLPANIQISSSDDNIISRLSCNESDWDIPYSALICCIIFVIFAIPLIYVFYLAEYPENFNHTHSTSS